MRWTDYSRNAPVNPSVLDVTEQCLNGLCDKCDWWPLRSAAPWYYSQVNCTGQFVWSKCNSTCAGAVKFLQFKVDIPAANGGYCQYQDGEVNATTAVGCPTNPCPVDCDGSWTAWSACNVTCGEGWQSRTYVITAAETNGGEPCSFTNGTIQQQQCLDWNDTTCTLPASLQAAEVCDTTTDGTLTLVPPDCDCATGTRNLTFIPNAGLSPAKNDSCEIIAGGGGVNTEMCPPEFFADCWGEYVWGSCSRNCAGGSQTGTFVITPPGKCGKTCDQLNITMPNGATTARSCNDGIVCTDTDCGYEWVPVGPCNVTCGVGMADNIFIVTAPPIGDGNCPRANGTQELRPCNETQGCICIADWTDWGACNASCGGGNQSRTFLVSQAAAPGWPACSSANDTVEWQACNQQPCPINCTGDWTAWSNCNATCNGGHRSRVFDILQDAAYGGNTCPYSNQTVEWEVCGLDPCPINCTGDWTGWGACNASCGGGNQSRMYEVYTPAQYNGTCPADNGTLEWQMCNTQPCPVNCTGAWTDWSACNASCAGGNQSRVFEVTIPAAHNGTCELDNGTVDWQACNTQPCPINCTSNWTDWGACNASCGGGTQSRVFEVSMPAEYNGTCDADNGTVNWQACNTHPCPVNCTGNWTYWGACNVSCGGGNQSSVFMVSAEAMHGGDNCSEVNGTVKWQECNTHYCPVNCTGAWTAWDTCNATCAGGNQSRVFYVTEPAAHGGQNCSFGNGTVQEQACNVQPCPINCVGAWTAWDECTLPCGSGTQTRRFQVSVAQAFGGTNCPAANGTVESQACNTAPCPVNCTGAWSPWGSCNVTCGGGNSSRTFEVTVNAVGTGQACSVADGQTE